MEENYKKEEEIKERTKKTLEEEIGSLRVPQKFKEKDKPKKIIEIRGDEIIEKTISSTKNSENFDKKTEEKGQLGVYQAMSFKQGEKENFSREKTKVTKDINKKTRKETSIKKKEVGEQEKKEKEIKKTNPFKTIRTYRDDVVQLMKKQKTSVSKIIIDKNKKQKETKKENLKKNKAFIFTIVILLFFVILGISTFYFSKTKNSIKYAQVKELKISTIVFPNYTKEIYLKRLRKESLLKQLDFEKKSISIPVGSLIQLYLTKEDKTKKFIIEETEGNKLLVTTEFFFKIIETKISSSLLRSLGSDFMFGYYSSFGNNPFLLLKVKSYNSSFSEMLKWEKTMFKDLYPLFSKEKTNIKKEKNDFKDIVLNNKDVRALLNSEGGLEFGYSFLDKETLLIFNQKTTLKELMRRLNNKKLERKN